MKQRTNVELVDEMCDRLGLPRRTGMKILANCHVMRLKYGRPIDMVLVAQAIKYVSENRQYLQPVYQTH